MVETEINDMLDSLKSTMELALLYGQEGEKCVDLCNNLAKKVCEVEFEYTKKLQCLNQAKQCDSVEEFDEILRQHEANADAFVLKNSSRYANFDKRVQKLKANANQSNSSIILSEVEAEQAGYLDPITKRPIENPVRNKNCGHIYGKDSMTQSLLQNPRMRCPIVGCGSKNFIKLTDLIEDDNIMEMLTQEHTHNIDIE